MGPELTVILPNYKTPELTRIALRLLRLHTPRPERLKVIAIDNDSRDDSTAYLRSVKWITLMERPSVPGEAGYVMHAKSLDMALEQVTTEFVMVMHTDTFVVSDQWLDYLLSFFRNDPKIAGVGSWKLERESKFKEFGQKIETFFRKLAGRKINRRERYLRSHCAVYRTELLRRYTGGFYDGFSAGEMAHKKLLKAGFSMYFIPAGELMNHVLHLNHATVILNPVSSDRKTGSAASVNKLAKQMEQFREMLSRTDLDE